MDGGLEQAVKHECYLSPGPLKKAPVSTLQKVSFELLSGSPNPSRTVSEDLMVRLYWRRGSSWGTFRRASPGLARVSVNGSFLQALDVRTRQSVIADARALMLELNP